NQKCERLPITTPPPSIGGGDTAEFTISEPVDIADNVTTEIPLGAIEAQGRVKFVCFDILVDHGNHGDMKFVLKNGATSAVIFDGQDSEMPNRGGELNVSLHSADHDVFVNLLGEHATGPWVLEVQD